MAEPVDTPIGKIDPDNPPSDDEVQAMSEWSGQKIAEDFGEVLRAFFVDNVQPFAHFVAETGNNPAGIWRSMAHLLRAAADGLDGAADELDAKDWPPPVE